MKRKLLAVSLAAALALLVLAAPAEIAAALGFEVLKRAAKVYILKR